MFGRSGLGMQGNVSGIRETPMEGFPTLSVCCKDGKVLLRKWQTFKLNFTRRMDMGTNFLDYKNRILDLRAAEKGAREEKERAILMSDRDAEKRWERAEGNARREADRLEQTMRQ